MRIKIDDITKRKLSIADLPSIKVVMSYMNDVKDLDWECKFLASNYIKLIPDILKVNMHILKNPRIEENYYGFGSGKLDVYINFIAYDGFGEFVKLGAFLSDIWMMNDENKQATLKQVMSQRFVMEK